MHYNVVKIRHATCFLMQHTTTYGMSISICCGALHGCVVIMCWSANQMYDAMCYGCMHFTKHNAIHRYQWAHISVTGLTLDLPFARTA